MYDAVIFGNGLTLNLLSWLGKDFPSEKRYLLSFDSFMLQVISGNIQKKEENRIKSVLYGKNQTEAEISYPKLLLELKRYYDMYDGNIEYYFGEILFNPKQDFNFDVSVIQSIFPAFYNIWFSILNEYIYYIKLGSKINLFCKNFSRLLDEDARIYTTNFDSFFAELNPCHIHGRFCEHIKSFDDIIYKKDEKKVEYNVLFGWNGIGKFNFLQSYFKEQGDSNTFCFDFLFGEDIAIDNLLVFGVAFQKSGFMEGISKINADYDNDLAVGGIIDEHILIRLKELQQNEKLNSVTFTYYADNEKEHYETIIKLFELKNVSLVKSVCFDFTKKSLTTC